VQKGEFMLLKLYLVKNKIKIKDFAESIGCSRTHLGEIMNGRRKIGTSLAKLIEIKTNGEVTTDEIMNEFIKE